MKKIQPILLSAALVSSLYAQNQYTLENITVSASQGTSLDKKSTTDNVIVITKEALEESHATNLADALNKLSSMSMTVNGVPGSVTSVFTRGMDSRRTLVLIDGIRYNSPAATSIDYQHLMLDNVEQIEIIKGAQSGVWGTDASAGVINIVTSKAKKGFHANANVEYGSFDTTRTALNFSNATEKYDISLGASILDTDGFSSAEPKRSSVNYGKRYDELGYEKDSYENSSLNAKLGFNVTSKDRIEASARRIDSDLDFDSGAGIDGNIENSQLDNQFYSLIYKHTGDKYNIAAQYNVSKFEQDGKTAFGSYLLKGSVHEAKIDNKIMYAENDFVRVGASFTQFEREKVTPTTDRDYSAYSIFATNYNKLNSNKTIVTESIRYDNYNEFKNSLTAKLGVKHFIENDFYVSTNIGTGYNAPTLGQLFGQWGANPNLKPEDTLTTDITIGNDTLWLTCFYNEVDNLIEYTTGYVQTSGTSKFKGIELGYEQYFSEKVGVNAMYTYLDAENANGQTLQRRPKHQINLNSTYYISDEYNLGLNAQYIGERYDNVNETGAQTGKYLVVNLVANAKINKNFTAYAKINNITDEYYQTVDGYATAERSFFVGLNAKY